MLASLHPRASRIIRLTGHMGIGSAGRRKVQGKQGFFGWPAIN
jgi:hypothetical protein